MKKIVLVALILAALMLSACSGETTENVVTDSSTTANQSVQPSTSNQAADNPSPAVSSANNGNAISADLQLLAGMLKLESSNLAISKDQAISILPLLVQYKSSRANFIPNANQQQNSSPAQQPTQSADARAKTDELIAQIQSLLSADQIKAIADMNLTRESIQTLMQELGITLNGGRQMGGGNQPRQGTPPAGSNNSSNAAPSDGNPPSGNGQNSNPQAANGQNTNPQSGNRPARGGMVPSQLIEKLIEILDGKAGISYSTPTPAA